MKVNIKPHSELDKKFKVTIGNVLCIYVDYDDVNHAETEAATNYLQSLIEKNWNDEHFQAFYKAQLLIEWDANKYSLQDDYEGINDYLEQHGFPPPNNY